MVFFVLLTGGCVVSGVPIAFAFGISTVVYLGMATRVPMSIVISRMDEGMSSLVLLAVPLFVVLGLLMEMTGLARVLVAFLVALCGHVRGGLSYALLAAMYLVSGISGAKAADMAAVAPVLFPEMKRRGTHEGELIAILAASAAMSETIPPSLVLIMIGSVTGVSISALFAGGLLPALVVAAVLVALAWWRSRREDNSLARRATPREIGRCLVLAIPALLLPLLIRAAVVDGVATATEVSTIGIAYCLVVGVVIYRQFDWRRVMPILVRHGVALGRDPADHRRGNSHGMGTDPIRLLAIPRADGGRGAGRADGLPAAVDPAVRRPGQRARGHPGDRAIRPAAIPGRAGAAHQ